MNYRTIHEDYSHRNDRFDYPFQVNQLIVVDKEEQECCHEGLKAIHVLLKWEALAPPLN